MSQPNRWSRLLGEATAIILSILAAFAIDAWWDLEQQRDHLDSLLDGIEDGHVEHIALPDENIDYVASDRENLRRFIEMAPREAADIPADRTWLTLEATWRCGVPEPSTGAAS